jgi:hypothetical protein
MWLSKIYKLSMACYILFSDRLTDYNFLGKCIRIPAPDHTTLGKFSAPCKFNKTKCGFTEITGDYFEFTRSIWDKKIYNNNNVR